MDLLMIYDTAFKFEYLYCYIQHIINCLNMSTDTFSSDLIIELKEIPDKKVIQVMEQLIETYKERIGSTDQLIETYKERTESANQLIEIYKNRIKDIAREVRDGTYDLEEELDNCDDNSNLSQSLSLFDGDIDIEHILSETKVRYVVQAEDIDLWNRYKQQSAAFWKVEQVPLADDAADWRDLPANWQDYLKLVLAFFASSDVIVVNKLGDIFLKYVTQPDAKCFYGVQLAIENIHSEMYALLIDTYISDVAEKKMLFEALEHYPSVAAKKAFIDTYTNRKLPFCDLLFAMSIFEGVFFCSSFCAIYWIKKKGNGKLKGLWLSNDWIARDEGMHRDFAVALSKRLTRKITEDRAIEIMRAAVLVEKAFVHDCLKTPLPEMNADLMCKYVECVADNLMIAYGFRPIYSTKNPFDWMDKMSLSNKSNFFEVHPSEYQIPDAATTQSDDDWQSTL